MFAVILHRVAMSLPTTHPTTTDTKMETEHDGTHDEKHQTTATEQQHVSTHDIPEVRASHVCNTGGSEGASLSHAPGRCA